MKTKCLSVRLMSFDRISEKCYKATAWDGSTDFIPASQYFGEDFTVSKSEAYWISEWILKQKKLQHSDKKVGWFDSETGKMQPQIKVEIHVPDKIEPILKNEPDSSLIR